MPGRTNEEVCSPMKTKNPKLEAIKKLGDGKLAEVRIIREHK